MNILRKSTIHVLVCLVVLSCVLPLSLAYAEPAPIDEQITEEPHNKDIGLKAISESLITTAYSDEEVKKSFNFDVNQKLNIGNEVAAYCISKDGALKTVDGLEYYPIIQNNNVKAMIIVAGGDQDRTYILTTDYVFDVNNLFIKQKDAALVFVNDLAYITDGVNVELTQDSQSLAPTLSNDELTTTM